MSNIAVLQQAEGHSAWKDLLDGIKFTLGLVLKVLSVTEVGKALGDAVSYVSKRLKKARVLRDSLRAVHARAVDLVSSMDSILFHPSRIERLDSIAVDLGLLLQTCLELLAWSGRRRFLKVSELETKVTYLKSTLERLELGFNREMLVTSVAVAEDTKAENAANAASIREEMDAGFEAVTAQQAASFDAFVAEFRAWQATLDARIEGSSRARDA